MTTISFPGLGIGEFTVNSTAFTIPIGKGIAIQWYAIIIVTGIILAFLYCSYRAKQEGIKFDDLLDIALFTVFIAVIGARAGYVLFSLDHYTSYYATEGLWGVIKQMINIRNGGLQIYGAIIAGAATIFVVCKVKKINPLKMLDSVGPAVMIGQIIGRWGNFMNGEAHGSLVSEGSPLYFLRMGLNRYYENGAIVHKYGEVHPTFLYESIWNLVGFVIIHLLYKKKKFDGQVVLMYLSWYGFGRMLIEMLRTDSLTIGNSGIRISVVIGLVCFLGGVTLIIIGLIKAHKKNSDDGEYTPTYARISHYGENTAEKTEEKLTVEEKLMNQNVEINENADETPKETKVDIEKKFQDFFEDKEDKNG